MTFRQLPLPSEVPGRLWLDAMPGRLQPWTRFIAEARRAGLTRIVCLTPQHEIITVSPAYHAAIVQGKLPCRWTLMPMRNFGLADEAREFREGVAEVADALRGGEVLLLHCAAGLGRTGTAAACVLKCLGLDADEALRRVRLAGSNPESALQSGMIDRF